MMAEAHDKMEDSHWMAAFSDKVSTVAAASSRMMAEAHDKMEDSHWMAAFSA